MPRFPQWLAAPRIERAVVAGLADCPLRRRPVALEGCLRCSFLSQAMRDEAGEVRRVVCAPVFGCRIASYR